jgi:pimeloyl-ACP methyl ester carboxylesterase
MMLKSFDFSGHEVFYRYHKNPREKGLLVFLNGLSDDIESWEHVVSYFHHDHSYVVMDLLGQGRTLLGQIEKGTTNFRFSVDEQSDVLTALLDHLHVQNKIQLIGFSYGGGIALKWASQHPQRIQKLILLLPYIIRLDQAYPINRFWWQQFNMVKAMPGILGRQAQMWEKVYENFLHEYMHYRYKDRIPDKLEREAAIHLSEEIMSFNSFQVLESLPEKSTYLLTVDRDTLIPNSLYHELWDRLPKHIRCAWLKISGGHHLLLEEAPLLVAQWLEKIIESERIHGVMDDAI